MLIAEKLVAVRKHIAAKTGVDPDRWGHIVVEGEGERAGKKYRYKFMDRVIRYELQVKHDHGNQWVRIKSYGVSEAYDALVKKNLI